MTNSATQTFTSQQQNISDIKTPVQESQDVASNISNGFQENRIETPTPPCNDSNFEGMFVSFS